MLAVLGSVVDAIIDALLATLMQPWASMLSSGDPKFEFLDSCAMCRRKAGATAGDEYWYESVCGRWTRLSRGVIARR